uniref:V-type proton ATPase subunit G n=1 Tax=Rousettus aegyptiacus TaxID=9407 RepID=A0A7J8K563_ROUAE|nr:ATPase H+ transporting V1 subunit G2 [Rousettus aegyptiacus]
MASQSQGIQQLLQAEKRAAEKVADARKRKARRLKQAKEEAQMEVEQYRRAPSRKTANASWLSFLVWSAMSGPRSTLTIGLLPRIQPRADSSCQFPPSKKSLNQNHFHCNPTLFSISQKF